MALILFDLDGTIIDSTDYLLQALHLAVEDMPHIQEPSKETLQSAYGLTGNAFWAKVVPDATPQEITIIRRRRSEFLDQLVKGKDILFPGVKETLQQLKDNGHTLTTASNCGTHYLDMILDSQDIRHYFSEPICLGTIHGEKKGDILTAHFDKFGKSEAFMVGDRYSDIEAAKEHDIPVIFCTYGFGSEEEASQADYRISRIEEVCSIVS
ncbi:haloacid dehalogenase [Jeotgalibacillus alimentarius]|uniref:Haloacid dehalogenase n=1 Tax=Jeotgalibacillus alimentarius TaxID=135826 RepID=A0A0C2RQX2_9BACL|nr:HAD family hydrolase [Jeotgalibacillus alimentarius]KIL52660.1 haloacid dehalogenase [Jeotgalibacillus alimentarius]